MGLPFTIVEGTILLTDKYGNIVGTKQLAGELDQNNEQLKRVAANALIQGGNVDGGERRIADVIYKSFQNRMCTDATVTVEQIFGQDNFADTWFIIEKAGAAGDTWTVYIAAQVWDQQAPYANLPAYTKVITVTATEAGDEFKLRDLIVNTLNADPLFNEHWKASQIKDNTIVHIGSKYISEYGTRPLDLDFNVTVTGTAQVGWEGSDNQKIITRGKKNSGARDPRDKRLVTVGVSGEVVSTPGAVGDLYIQNLLNAGSPYMNVNGSVTPVEFAITPNGPQDKDIFITELRFYGNANGIKFGNFLNLNGSLTNGILVEIKSDDALIQLPVIKVTDDFKHKFAFGIGQGFQLHVQAGRDDFLAAFTFSAPFPIRRQNTFTTNDYVKCTIRDNLSSILDLGMLAYGFEKEV